MSGRKWALALAAGLVAVLGGLWLAGPAPLATGPFVERVTAHSAVVSRIDRSPSQLELVVEAEGAAGGAPIRVSETAPVIRHAVRVEGLEPATHYRYRLDGDVGRFRTAPIDDRTPVRFAAVGDSGAMPWWFNMHRFGWGWLRPLLELTQRTGQWDVAEWIAAQDPDFFVHLGDIVYWPRDRREAHEEAFFRPFDPVLRRGAVFAITGNHDYPLRFAPPPFDEIFLSPESTAPNPKRNYSFAWGSVRVVAVESPVGIWRPDTELHRWVDHALAAAAEPWLVVVVHTPCQSAFRPAKPLFQKSLCRLFELHGVDLVVSGDDHLYQRFRRRVADGPIQVTAGGGGKDLYDVQTDHPQLELAVKEFGFLLVEADGARLVVQALGEGGRVLDRFEIDRRSGPLPAAMSAARRARLAALRSDGTAR